MECSVEGCDRKHLARGWCRKHYEAFRRTGDPLGGIKTVAGPCSSEGCGEITVGKGLCRKHYGREYMRQYREARRTPREPRPCKFCGKPVPATRSAKALFCSKECKSTFELGATLAEYEELLAAQDGRCAICKRMEPNGQHKRWCVDHDHKTGRKRGLLCINCNSAIGLMNDDPALLLAAIEYLAPVVP
jgi:ribosomal protein L37AE/L43A